MQLKNKVGFAGTVYRPGQEQEFEAAIAKAKAAKTKDGTPHTLPDLDALAATGVIEFGNAAASGAEPTGGEGKESAKTPANKGKGKGKSTRGK